MNKALKAIIEEGVNELEELAERSVKREERARSVIERCKADMTALVRFAEDLPQAMLDKMSLVMTTDFSFEGNYGSGAWASLEVKGQRQMLRGMFGSSDEKLAGKYRAIVILSKVD
jgi:hypothetical protein